MNNLIDAALARSRTVLVSLFLLLIAGGYVYATIPKEAEPDINIPQIYIIMTHDGISPEDAERLLVRPMEQELKGLEGMKEMRAITFLGGANIILEFDAGFDPDQALSDVREKVDLAKPELPTESEEPSVQEVNISLFPIINVTLSGAVPERTLVQLAGQLQDQIEDIPSVLEADIAGDREELIELIIDPLVLESYNLDARGIIEGVAQSNLLIAAGALDTGQGRFSIKVPGLFESVQDIMSMPLKVDGDAVVQFEDIGTLRRTYRDPEGFARINGQRAVTIEVRKRTGTNIIDTIAAVRSIVEATSQDWPDGIQISYSQDRSTSIRDMLNDLQNNVLLAVLLVMIVIIGTLGARSAGLVGVAIPGSFLTGLLVLGIAGLTVNIVVLFSLILAVGMLVDGAIVVTELADRKIKEGMPRSRAYGLAAKRMAWPITASTATTLAAFLPLAFWPGVVGEFMKFLPITLLATLTASLAMALIFIPVLGAKSATVLRGLRTLALTGAGAVALYLLFGLIGEIAAILGLLLGGVLGFAAGLYWLHRQRGTLPVDVESADEDSEEEDTTLNLEGLSVIARSYVSVLSAALRVPLFVILGAFVFLVGSYVAYGVLGRGVEFFPEVEPDNIIVQVHGRGNLSVYERDALLQEVEAVIMQMQDERPEFHAIVARSVATSGTRSDDEAEDLIGSIQLEFVDWDRRRTANDIITDLRVRTQPLAGLVIEVRKEEGGPPVGKPVQMQVSSQSPELLEPVVARLLAAMHQIGGFVDLEEGRPVPAIEWQLAVDRAHAARFGADVSLIGSYVRMVTNGTKLGEFRPDDADDEIDIVVRLPEIYRNLDQLDDIRIQTNVGLIPIANFVTRSARPESGILHRIDGARTMTIKAEVGINPESGEPYLAADKVAELRAWVDSQDFDPRVTITFRGEDEEQREATAFLSKAFLVALFLMAIILVTQFNSFYSAFLILSAVIMSTVGVLLGLLVTQQPFGIVMSGIGVIALAGIVVNNNIVLIDTYDRIRKRVDDERQAIILTGAQRLRPVLLTTVTTILGLMPMVLGLNLDFFAGEISFGAPSTQWWRQLSTAIVFGLAFATVLTLIVTPSALMLRGSLGDWWTRIKPLKPRRETA